MPCKVCGVVETVKAHLIPRALMHEIRGDFPHASAGRRYAVSRRGEADKLRLAPYDLRLRQLIFEPKPNQAEPELVICRREQQLEGRTIPLAVNPHMGRVEGRTYWRFLVSNLDFRMKLDARSDGIPRALLANGADPVIVCGLGSEDVLSVPEYRAIFTRMQRPRGREV